LLVPESDGIFRNIAEVVDEEDQEAQIGAWHQFAQAPPAERSSSCGYFPKESGSGDGTRGPTAEGGVQSPP
jgi:hypothetical protein